MGCIKGGCEGEYRSTIQDFVNWSSLNHLRLNISKTKEMVFQDFRKKRPKPEPVSIQGTEVELVSSYKYLGVQLDNKLDWSSHMEAVHKKGQSRLYFLRRLRSFNICKPLPCSFYKTVAASAFFFGVVCWGGGSSHIGQK